MARVRVGATRSGVAGTLMIRSPAVPIITLYGADGANEHVYVFERNWMELLTHFGQGGRQPGQFFGVHSIATDSQGNIYTTETYTGKRVQKFINRGLKPVTSSRQGAPWPARSGK